MTTKNWDKTLWQLEKKPAKLSRLLKSSKPKDRKFGASKKHCRICGRNGAHITKYNLNLCRQCFRDFAHKLGFKKYGAEV